MWFRNFAWLALYAASARAFCNWCYLGSCLVDFSSDFCISTCQKPPMEDGIDWQQSEGLFSQALDVWPSLSPTAIEHKQWLGFYFESIQMGPGCEAAALTAQLLAVAFLTPDAMEEVSKVLSLTDEHLDPHAWVPRWFLTLTDPTSICLSGWHVFFEALEKALESDSELAACPFEAGLSSAQEALGLLHAAAETAGSLSSFSLRWQQAVGQRIVKDRLRHAFELLAEGPHADLPQACLRGIAAQAARVCAGIAKMARVQDWMIQRLTWPELPATFASGRHAPARIAVCIVGQPRAMFGTWFGPIASQLLQSLCPLTAGSPRISLFFMLATQPRIGLHSDMAPMIRDALQSLLEKVDCPKEFDTRSSLSRADLLLDLQDDAPDEELEHLVSAYPEDAWWHGEGDGRLKWVRQLQNLARCYQQLEREGVEDFDWVVLLRPDLLHLVPLPELQYIDPSNTLLLADSGMQITPQSGYLEGLDRALAMSGRVARAILLEPLLAVQNQSFVQLHPTCLKCSGWRSPGVKLTPEKHFANVLQSWASQRPLELRIAYEWRQPLVLSEKGCINLLPCEGDPCTMNLPRWARQLVVAQTCWNVKDEVAAKSWAQSGSTEAISGPAANYLAEIFPDFRI